MKTILAYAAAFAFLAGTVTIAQAARIDATIDAMNDSVAFASVYNARRDTEKYAACANVYGTFNGATIHFLVSTDHGTTKVPMEDLTGTDYTITTATPFCFEWGWPAGNADSTIFFASVAGASSAPSLTITVDDNR